jgi:hypothetical protein
MRDQVQYLSVGLRSRSGCRRLPFPRHKNSQTGDYHSKHHATVLTAVFVGVTATFFVAPSVVGEINGPSERVGDRECCISVRASTSEEGRTLSVLNIGYGKPGSYVTDFSEKLLADLKKAGFKPVVTCFQLTEAGSVKGASRLQLGRATRRKAARPLFATSVSQGDSRVLFLDQDLSTRSVLTGSNLQSRHGKYVAVLNPVVDTIKGGPYRLSICDYLGRKHCEIPLSYLQAADYAHYVTDDGRLVATTPYPRFTLELYDQSGSLAETHAVGQSPGNGTRVQLGFSENGRYIAVHVLTDENQNEFVMYDSGGREIWRSLLDLGLGASFCVGVSADGSRVISSHPTREPTNWNTIILDGRGRVVKTVEGFEATRIEFSQSGKHVVLYNPLNVLVLESGSGEVLCDHKTSGRASFGFAFAEDRGLLAIIDSGSVKVVDLKGNWLWYTADFPYLKGISGASNVGYRVSLSGDGEELSFTAGDHFYLYRRTR